MAKKPSTSAMPTSGPRTTSCPARRCTLRGASVNVSLDTLTGVDDETLRQRADALWHRWY